MNFKDRIKQLADRVSRLKGSSQTEEITSMKHYYLLAIILLFITSSNSQAQAVTISGRVFLDANGMTDNTVNGTPWANQLTLDIRSFSPTIRYDPGTITILAPIASDGTFSFTVAANTTLHLFLAESSGPVTYPYITYPTGPPLGLVNAKITGAHIGAGTGSNIDADGFINISLTDQPIADIKFGVDRYPVAGDNITTATQPNPLGTARVQVPTLASFDPDDGVGSDIRIHLYSRDHYGDPLNRDFGYGPNYSILYYDGIPVTENQVISNYDPTKLTVDPTDGNVTTRFDYSAVDAAGLESKKQATITIPFSDTVTQLDFGDAPSNYGTRLDYFNGPRHVIIDGLRLGSLVDAEVDGQLYEIPGGLLDKSATGDDITGIDDEDGIASFPALHVNQPAYVLRVAVTNTTGLDAMLSGWIDFNVDHQFSENERTQVIVPSGVTSVTLTWTSITWTGGGIGGPSIARFRLANAADEVANTGGQANSGEVEDYALPIQPRLAELSAGASLQLANVGVVVSLTASGAITYQWKAPSGAQFTTSATSQFVSASLITAGVQTFTLVATIGDYSQTLLVSVTAVSGPDLTAIISLPDANFQAGGSKDWLVQLQEVNGETANGAIVITITAPAGYTIDFNNSLTSINVSGGINNPVAVQNSKWQVSSNAANHQLSLTIKGGESVGANTTLNLGFTITRTTANTGSTSNITINVADDGGGSYDVNRSNNIYARVISGL